MRNVKIELDRERSLRFDMNAMAKFEEVTGASAFEIGNNMSARVIRALVWCCLIHEDKELTLEQVGECITLDKMEYVSSKIAEVLESVTEKGISSKN